MAEDNKTRDQLLTIRVTSAERSAMKEMAFESGFKNLSDYVRSLIPVKKEGDAVTGQATG